ncbi:Hypothetical protein FKW44_008913, partial [Caligus rogercresseyi]
SSFEVIMDDLAGVAGAYIWGPGIPAKFNIDVSSMSCFHAKARMLGARVFLN